MPASTKTAARHALVLILGCVLLAPLAAQPARLHVLAATGTAEEIRTALEAGADFNDHDYSGVTALMAAASTNRDPGVVLVLLRHGAVVDARDRNGETALMLAAARNSDAAVASALLKAGAALENRDLLGRTALIHAAMSNPSLEVVAALLKAGANVNARDSKGLSPLLYAAWVGRNPDIAVALLDAGADATARGATGRILVEYAEDNPAFRGEARVLRQLEEAMRGVRTSAERARAGAVDAKEGEG